MILRYIFEKFIDYWRFNDVYYLWRIWGCCFGGQAAGNNRWNGSIINSCNEWFKKELVLLTVGWRMKWYWESIRPSTAFSETANKRQTVTEKRPQKTRLQPVIEITENAEITVAQSIDHILRGLTAWSRGSLLSGRSRVRIASGTEYRGESVMVHRGFVVRKFF